MDNRAAGDHEPRRGPDERGPILARVAAWLIVPLYVAGIFTYDVLQRSAGLWTENPVDTAVSVVLSIGLGAFAVVGAILVAKRPTNLVGWIMAAIALMVAIFNTGSIYAAYVVATRGQPGSLALMGAWVGNCYWFVMLALALIYLPMLFPDGRLLSRRWAPGRRARRSRALGLRAPQGAHG